MCFTNHLLLLSHHASPRSVASETPVADGTLSAEQRHHITGLITDADPSAFSGTESALCPVGSSVAVGEVRDDG